MKRRVHFILFGAFFTRRKFVKKEGDLRYLEEFPFKRRCAVIESVIIKSREYPIEIMVLKVLLRRGKISDQTR